MAAPLQRLWASPPRSIRRKLLGRGIRGSIVADLQPISTMLRLYGSKAQIRPFAGFWWEWLMTSKYRHRGCKPYNSIAWALRDNLFLPHLNHQSIQEPQRHHQPRDQGSSAILWSPIMWLPITGAGTETGRSLRYEHITLTTNLGHRTLFTCSQSKHEMFHFTRTVPNIRAMARPMADACPIRNRSLSPPQTLVVSEGRPRVDQARKK